MKYFYSIGVLGFGKPQFGQKVNFFLFVCMIASLTLLSACDSDKSFVIVAGSTSVQPYVEVLAEEYTHLFPDYEIDIQGGGSSAGITAAESGTANIGMSSRELNEEEQRLWYIEIAKDGLTLIVHPDNPISDLSLEQIRDIYSGKVTHWNQLNTINASNLSDKRIHVISREEGSGTRSAFELLVMGSESITTRAIVQNSNGSVRQIVSGDPNAIGFISMGLVDSSVKALLLDGVEASWENVMNDSYKLYRPFIFIFNKEPEGDSKLFLDYVLSPEGQAILKTEGLIPVAAAEY